MKVHHRQLFSMGTRFDLVVAGTGSDTCDLVHREIREELDRIEDRLSLYRPGSFISLLNTMAHAGPVELDAEMEEMFREIRLLHTQTGGYFDVTMKPVADYLRDYPETERKGLEKVMTVVGMDKIILEKGAIRFAARGVTVDLGGYGKGYAMRRLIPVLEDHRIEHALLNFGESLVYGRGTHPYGDSWKIGISAGEGTGPLEFLLHDEALSTSGNSLNNQKKFANSGHIVNPRTLELCPVLGQVSVKAADPVLCEVYSTALFSAGRDRQEEVLKNVQDLEPYWSAPGQ
jgi:thiamine biosynthesis lipoprotein